MMSLAMVAAGETVKLIGVRGGQRVSKRLADLGLTPDTIVRVVQANPYGPLIVAFKEDVRLALGRGMAHKIQVELID